MRPFRATAVALVAVAAGGAAPALGATEETFTNPQWNFAQSNRPFHVYACDGSTADCSKAAPPTSGAAEKAHVYCSDGNWLDRKGLLTWYRPGSANEYPTFSDFKTAPHTGSGAFEKWASVPTSPGDYSTGTGGHIFTEIKCGVARPSAGEHSFFAKLTAVTTYPVEDEDRVGIRHRAKTKIDVELEVTGTFGPSRNIAPRNAPPNFRQIMDSGRGHATGEVSVEEVFRTCRDELCRIKRLDSYRTTYKLIRRSLGEFIHTEKPTKRVEKRVLGVIRGLITKSTRPDCKGPRRRSPLALRVFAIETPKTFPGYNMFVSVRYCRRVVAIAHHEEDSSVRGRMKLQAPKNRGPTG